MAELDSETKELIEKLSGLIMAAVADKALILWEGCEVFSAPVGVAPEYLDVMVDGVRDQNVYWRGVPTPLAVTDLVSVVENPVTHRREIWGGSGTTGTSGGVGPHTILSATHTDTVAAAVALGDLMTGQGVGPDWTRLPLGTRGYFLRSDGTDVLWTLFAGDTYLIGSGGNCDYARVGDWVIGAHATPATLFLQEDTFVENPVTLPANTHVIGQGAGTIIDMQAWTLTLNTGCSLNNLTVTSSNANQTVDDNNGTVEIRDCIILNTAVAGNGYGVFTDGTLEVYNSVIDGYRAGIQGDNGSVMLWNCDVSGDLYGIRVNHASADWETLYCRFTGATYDVYIITGAWDHFACQFDPSNVSIAAGTHTALPTKRFNQTVIVAEEGGDFQLVSEAITWINAQGDAATGKRYGVLVLTGNFTEAGDVTIPAWVTVCGMGKDSRIEFGANNLRMSDDSALWNLTVYSTDGSSLSINNADCELRDVTVINDGTGTIVIDITGDSDCQLYDVLVEATGTVLYGISVNNTATVLLDHCIVDDTTNFTLGALLLSNAALTCTTRYCVFHGGVDDVWVGSSATWEHMCTEVAISNITLNGTVVRLEHTEIQYGVAAYNNANVVGVVTATWTAMPLNSEVGRWDDAGYHDTVVNNSRFTVPTGLEGWYTITGHLMWDSNAVGGRLIGLRLNGVTFIAQTGFGASGGGLGTRQSIAREYYLAVGDYVELMGWQGSGGNLDVLSVGNYSPELAMARE